MLRLLQCCVLRLLHQISQVKARSRIMAVGVTDAIDEELLTNMVTDPATDFISVADFGQLTNVIVTITESVRPCLHVPQYITGCDT